MSKRTRAKTRATSHALLPAMSPPEPSVPTLAAIIDTPSTQPSPLQQESETPRCKLHQQEVQFLCLNKGCLRELCGYCILHHKEHIEEIRDLKEVVANSLTGLEEWCIGCKTSELVEKQVASLQLLDQLSELMRAILNKKINSMKERLIVENEKVSNYIRSFSETVGELKRKKSKLGQIGLRSLKMLLRSKKSKKSSKVVIEDNMIEKELSKIINNNVSFQPNGLTLNSSLPQHPKILHWFEWEKRDLHLFDVTTYTHRTVRLAIYFKIPPFSRSIMTPEGKIFLMGGEDPEAGPKREVFFCSLQGLNTDLTLHTRAPMLTKRYDFALCQLNGDIYVIAGKDGNGEVIGSVERYDVSKDQWTAIAPVNKRRYAASAVGMAEFEKIYLFGGRSDGGTGMAEEIEEYDLTKDAWKSLKLRGGHIFEPMEVCAAIQVGSGKILVFGGTDSSTEDSERSFLFSPLEGRFEKVGSLKKPHVFVSLPFLHGNNVFAVGNEYHVKNRNIHRFDIEAGSWEILF